MSAPQPLAQAQAEGVLTAAALKALVWPGAAAPACACGALKCAGWDSIPAPLAEPAYECVRSLRTPGDDEPTLTEWHPQGTSYWSAQAPLALDWFPYNRCAAWRCRGCSRGFVQYTEFGGYYVDHRVREINPALVV